MLIGQMSPDLDTFQAAYKNKASFFHLEVPLSVHSERPNLGVHINETREQRYAYVHVWKTVWEYKCFSFR